MNFMPGDKLDAIYIPKFGQVGAFGNVVFEVSSFKVKTFDDFNYSVKARFAEHKLLNQLPALEFLGEDAADISLSVALNSKLGINPRKEFQTLNDLCRNGQAEYLVIGTKVIGKFFWVIDNLKLTANIFDGHGNIMIANVDISFKEYRGYINA